MIVVKFFINLMFVLAGISYISQGYRDYKYDYVPRSLATSILVFGVIICICSCGIWFLPWG